jgi:hypothetical protein
MFESWVSWAVNKVAKTLNVSLQSMNVAQVEWTSGKFEFSLWSTNLWLPSVAINNVIVAHMVTCHLSHCLPCSFVASILDRQICVHQFSRIG